MNTYRNRTRKEKFPLSLVTTFGVKGVPGALDSSINQNMLLLKEVVQKMILISSGVMSSNMMDNRLGSFNIK